MVKTLVYRKLSLEDKAKINQGCASCVDLLYNEMKLEKWQCYLVAKTLFEEFPIEELKEKKGE